MFIAKFFTFVAFLTATNAFLAPSAPKFRGYRHALMAKLGEDEKVVVIGVAADSGCGKSTFMRRLTNVFGGDKCGPLGGGFGTEGGWETNTLVSDTTTVICLDDYHANDRQGRKESGLTALNSKEQNFDLMYEQIQALKNGESIKKPIYNHVNGTLDTPEEVTPTPIVIIEGLHPWHDDRVKNLLDYTIYLDISDEIKQAWKIQRDMAERGWTLEQVQEEIQKRKPDFDQFVMPQKKSADAVVQVLPTELTQDDTGKFLKVKYIQKKGAAEPVFLFDETSQISWTPSTQKIKPGPIGLKLESGPDDWFGTPVDVVSMDGEFEDLSQVGYIESAFGNTAAKFAGEVTEELKKNEKSPGSMNGSGLFQTMVSLKIREVYEKLTNAPAAVPEPVADEKVSA